MFKYNKEINKPLIIFTVAIVSGVLIMLYPIISSKVNYSKSLKKINDYTANVSENPDKVNDSILENARNYNKKIVSLNIDDSFSDQKKDSEEYLSQLDINGNGIMGYIKIPRIDVEIPIYHGTGSGTLQKGVGHLEGSSLPVGGKGTHSILSGHRGLPSSKLFTDLDQLKKDDMFYIYILDNVLAYKVNQVKVVDPSDTKDLAIAEGKDYITLVTCTPYALNTHRLLVRGEHVKYKEEVLNNIKASRKITAPDMFFFGGLLIAIIIIVITIRRIIILSRGGESLENASSDSIAINNQVSNSVDNIEVLDSNDVSVDTVLSSNNGTVTNTNDDIEVLDEVI